MIKWIKKLFGHYDSCYEYYVYLSNIKINPKWQGTEIKEEKLQRKYKYWCDNGKFQSKIILNKDWLLIDGYSSYKIAELTHMDKVPVYFALNSNDVKLINGRSQK